MKNILVYALSLAVLATVGCNDGSIIGNDLLEDETIELIFDDNFELTGRTVAGDSIATFRKGASNFTVYLGELDDPVFGKVSSDIYCGFTFGSSLPSYKWDTDVIDSIVLYLDYAVDPIYGEDDVTHTIEVFRLEEEFLSRDTIYSDESFATSMTPLGSRSWVPNPEGDSIRWQVRDTEVDSFVNLTSRINIRLDDMFGTEILQDTFAAKTDSAILAAFKGLYLKSTVDGSSMLGLNFEKTGSISELVAKMAVFYTQLDDDGLPTKRTYNYLLRNEAFSNFVIDYTGSPVGASLGSYNIGEEVVYVQGLSGVNGEIDLPDLSALKGNLINSAQLVMTINEEDEVLTDPYTFNQRFLLSRPKEDGDGRVLIDDLTKDDVAIGTGLQLLDGQPKPVLSEATGDSITTVTFNITDYIKRTVEEENATPKLIISPVGRAETPRRTVFYGAKHPTYPAKLRIAYTVL